MKASSSAFAVGRPSLDGIANEWPLCYMLLAWRYGRCVSVAVVD